MSKITIYYCEVGIELEPTHKEYHLYNIHNRSLYDENVIAYLDYEKAKKYAIDYVKKGVKNTYGLVWKVERTLEKEELQEIKDSGTFEDFDYLTKDDKILFFNGGIKSTKSMSKKEFERLIKNNKVRTVQHIGITNIDKKIMIQKIKDAIDNDKITRTIPTEWHTIRTLTNANLHTHKNCVIIDWIDTNTLSIYKIERNDLQ